MTTIELKVAIILKNIAFYLFGTVIFAGFITIVKHYDPELKNDDFTIYLASISWSAYCTLKCFIELNDRK